MKTYEVSFQNVGANKRSWTATMKELSYSPLYRQVKEKGGNHEP